MKSVVLCGSRRFEAGIRALAADLRGLGVVVYEPTLHQAGEEWKTLSEQYKRLILTGLTHDHFQKIRQADVVFVFNENGYVGPSTTLEIGVAVALGKPIYSLAEDKEEGSRDCLFRPEHPATAEELLQFLR